MTQNILLFVGALHVAVNVWWLLRRSIDRRAVFFPLVFLLPVVGIALALILKWQGTRYTKTSRNIPNMFAGTVASEKPSAVADEPDRASILPFEEALLIGDESTQREILMNILREDPSKYLGLLNFARHSDDVEITHYATATIMAIQGAFDKKTQEALDNYTSAPDSLIAINRYMQMLSEYINSGLLSGHSLAMHRQQLQEVLTRKLSLSPNSKGTHFRLVDNAIHMGDCEQAMKAARSMRDKWPNDEAVWLKSLQVCICAKDSGELESVVSEMGRREIRFSNAVKKDIGFLLRGEFVR